MFQSLSVSNKFKFLDLEWTNKTYVCRTKRTTGENRCSNTECCVEKSAVRGVQTFLPDTQPGWANLQWEAGRTEVRPSLSFLWSAAGDQSQLELRELRRLDVAWGREQNKGRRVGLERRWKAAGTAGLQGQGVRGNAGIKQGVCP